MPTMGEDLEGGSPVEPQHPAEPQPEEQQLENNSAAVDQSHDQPTDEPTQSKTETSEPVESDTLLDKSKTSDKLCDTKQTDESSNVENGKEVKDEVKKVGEDIEGQEEEGEDSKKRSVDVRCIVIGLLVIIIMVGGASVAILAHRFKAEMNHELYFASYYMDDMVLQRAPHRAVVWGYGPLISENTTVTISLIRGDGPSSTDNIIQQHTVNIRNTVGGQVWRVVLNEVGEAGPFTLIAQLNPEGQESSSSVQSASLHRVLFGDVWLCGGQDNMQMNFMHVVGGEDVLKDVEANGKDLPIRMFSLLPAKSDVPWYNIRGVQLPWSKPSHDALLGKRMLEGQIAGHFSALCWLFGKKLQSHLQYPVGLVSVTYARSGIDEWLPPAAHEVCSHPMRKKGSSSIWNAMVNPLLDMSMYGVIWYQGEQDGITDGVSGGGHNYNCSMIELVKQWREESYRRTLSSTNPLFPFGIVQLLPHKDRSRLTYGYTDIRWRQTANYGYLPNSLLPETFLAVTIDLAHHGSLTGNVQSINKTEIANRLVGGALGVGYRRNDVRHQGPLPSSYKISKQEQTLSLMFSYDIEVKQASGFEVCCSNNASLPCPSSFVKVSYAPGREWVAAPIVTHDGTSVTLSTASCYREHELVEQEHHVVELRYAWSETPCDEEGFKTCAVYEMDDPNKPESPLPMPPDIQVGLKDDGLVRPFTLNRVDLI